MTRCTIVLWLLIGLNSASRPGFAADPFRGADPTWSLLHEPAIERELKLSPAQTRQYRALLDGLDARFFPLRNKPRDEGAEEATAILAQAATRLESLLTAAQVRRLAEIQARVRGTEALLQDGMARLMNYTPEQRERLASVISETFAATRDLEARAGKGEPREPLEKHYTELKREELQAVMKILTPQQQSAWRTALGRDFDLTRLGNPSYRVPEIVDSGDWLNSEPLTLESLAGNVVVVHFYAFGCINCIRNYPTYLDWHERFRGRKVVILGIHTPETPAEENSATVKVKADGAAFEFPIVLDNAKANWNAWGNSMWPSVYLVDKRGYLRAFWPGELQWNGATGDAWMAARIEELLAEPDPRPTQD
jgi:thiol-disulfide isomerase/thioredoxin